jgi:hypothetical protein
MYYDLAEKVSTIVYELNGITYLPHYKKVNCFVRPGYGRAHHDTYTAAQLIFAGAKTSTEYLFTRAGGDNGSI